MTTSAVPAPALPGSPLPAPASPAPALPAGSGTADQGAVDRIVAAALAEDLPWGDVTSEALLPQEARATAFITAREAGIFCGGQVVEAAFSQVSADTAVILLVREGEAFEAGGILAEVSGPARAVLAAERVALNLVQRLCAIATTTAAFVQAAQGTKARITDTRKTTPGLRALERHAVRCGGGRNHRFSLSDAVLVKDNHLALLADGGDGLAAALRSAKAGLPHTMHFEVEVDRMDQIEPVLAGGADTVLLDNFTLADLRAAVELIGGRARTEASGSIQLADVAAVAATGVDLISSGALTHSVRALDLGLDINLQAAP